MILEGPQGLFFLGDLQFLALPFKVIVCIFIRMENIHKVEDMKYRELLRIP